MKILVKYKKRKSGYISIGEVVKVKRIILAFVYILSTLISFQIDILKNNKHQICFLIIIFIIHKKGIQI